MKMNYDVNVDLKGSKAVVNLSVERVQADSDKRGSWYWMDALEALEAELTKGVEVVECTNKGAYVTNFGAESKLSATWEFTLSVPQPKKKTKKASNVKSSVEETP